MCDKFNKDELEAPAWMNISFFEDVLKKSENTDSIQVKEIKMSPGSAKGDHFASIMFRATISYDLNNAKGLSKSLIIKTMPVVEGLKKDMLEESFIFETEIAMYSKTIPAMEAELRKIGDPTVLGAKAVYHSLIPHKCIIFEDIVPLGYETSNERMAGLKDSKIAILKLAKWHAVSSKLAAEGDKSVTHYREGLFSIKELKSSPLVANGMKIFIAKCGTMEEFKPYVPKLQEIQKDLLKRCSDSFYTYEQKNSEGVFVLCHGDFHIKNMMFKKNSKGETEDVMLLDFQLCFYGPAILDILYSLYMLVDENVRLNHRDELIYYYCSNYIETLEKLKFQGFIPKIADFFIDILRHRHWEVFLMTTFLPLWHNFNEGDIVDAEELMSSEGALKKLYENENFFKEVRLLLPMMLYKGYLE